MQFHRMTKILAAGVLGCVLVAPAMAEKVSMESATANSVVGLMPQTMAAAWAKAGVEIELALDQTLTKSLLKVGQGSLDSAVMPPPAYAALLKGAGPYQSMGAKGADLAANVRSLWGFSGSLYHTIVWADGGITDWSKIKGKRVYVGPPAGAANAQIRDLIKAASGYEDGKDYEGIKAPWGAAIQGFQDGQYDMLITATGLGSKAMAELGLTRNFRMLALDPKAEPPKGQGMVKAVVPAGTYAGQVNKEDVNVWQTTMMVVVNKKMSDDTAYKLTKTYFEQLPAMRSGNAMLKDLSADQRFGGVIAPLHPGAVRYYKEQGIAMPDDLLGK